MEKSNSEKIEADFRAADDYLKNSNDDTVNITNEDKLQMYALFK